MSNNHNVIALPLRLPLDPLYDFVQPLSTWLSWAQQQQQQQDTTESSSSSSRCCPVWTAEECRTDLQRLSQLRQETAIALQQEQVNTTTTTTTTQQDALHTLLTEYAAALQEFITAGFVLSPEDPGVCTLEWRRLSSCDNNNDDDDTDTVIHAADKVSLAWERTNVLWNIVSLTVAAARPPPTPTPAGDVHKQAWVAAGTKYTQAACWLQHGMESNNNDYQQYFRIFPAWRALCRASAQRAAYHAFATLRRPKPFMLAKLAVAAVALHQQAEEAIQAAWLDEFPDDWRDYCRAVGMYLTAATEYHRACQHGMEQEWGAEICRLQAAVRFGELYERFASSCCAEEEGDGAAGLVDLRPWLDESVAARLTEAQRENDERWHSPLPDYDELPVIPPQISLKHAKIATLLPPCEQPFFTNVLDPVTRMWLQQFRRRAAEMCQATAATAEAKTETARKALAMINLPHSLTAFRQEQAGGGIPTELWDRIRECQETDKEAVLKQELWELRDVADQARTQFSQISAVLEEDLQMDGAFRQVQRTFEGHDVQEIQKTFRKTMANYDRLMAAAEESDALLLQRCEILDTDGKFRFLKFTKSQLDHLLPGRDDCDNDVDVSTLSQQLVHLSALFTEREELIHRFQQAVASYNMTAALQPLSMTKVAATEEVHAAREEEYARVVQDALESFAHFEETMGESIQQQEELLPRIVDQNEIFLRSRGSSSSSNVEEFIVTMEDALEELDQFAEHLREGRAFYEVIIPKLTKLKQQVGDVSARLTIERCEFEERQSRSLQEQRDAQMARQFESGGGRGSAGRPPSNRLALQQQQPREHAQHPPQHQSNPRVQAVSHGQAPPVVVDDEKVATLVGMDFDPDRVVQVLQRHDNDVDKALNDLLT